MIRSAIGRHIPRQPEIVAFAIALPIASAIGWFLFHNRLAFLSGFDVAASVYLGSILRALASAKSHILSRRATRYDAGRKTLLFLAALVLGVVLVAVATELGHGPQRTRMEIVVIVVTLVLAWCFGNMIFGLEYMHRHYVADSSTSKELRFPGDSEPSFWDFVYFAYTIGMTFQTSDVEIGTTALRRLVTLHALVAFMFNVGVVALSVNLLASG